MCLIIAAKNVKPSHEILTKGYLDNDDGAGIAFFNSEGMAEYRKGLNLQEIKDEVDKTDLPFIIHFRASSIGGKSRYLNHPFEVTPESELNYHGICEKLLFQNGTYHNYDILMMGAGVDSPDDNILSDARGIAMVLATMTDDKQLNLLKKLSKVGTHGGQMGQKFILMDSKTQQFKMTDNFTYENGMYFSNTYWKYKTIHNNTTIHYPALLVTIPAKRVNQPNDSIWNKHSPLLGEMEFNDKKKYFKSLKIHGLLNGGQSVKFSLNSSDADSYTVCRFCDKLLTNGRVNTLNILNFANWEMFCSDCAAYNDSVSNFDNVLDRNLERLSLKALRHPHDSD